MSNHTKFKTTKENLLTPRPCPSCKREMSREFLEERLKQRGKKIAKGRREGWTIKALK